MQLFTATIKTKRQWKQTGTLFRSLIFHNTPSSYDVDIRSHLVSFCNSGKKVFGREGRVNYFVCSDYEGTLRERILVNEGAFDMKFGLAVVDNRLAMMWTAKNGKELIECTLKESIKALRHYRTGIKPSIVSLDDLLGVSHAYRSYHEVDK